MPDSLIAASGLRKSFGTKSVLAGLDLRVSPGSVYGLVGLNGTGKTTLIRLLLGLLRPTGGEAAVLGRDPWRHEAALYRDCGVVLEHDGFSGSLTCMQNMSFFAAAKGLGRRQLADYLDAWWPTHAVVRSATRVKEFSRGQRMQAALCRAFAGWPRAVFLDEPTVGLDVEENDHLCALVREARRRGSGVLISSHQLPAIEELCDEVGLLREGVLRRIEAPDGVAEHWLLRAEGPDVGAIVAANGGQDVSAAGECWHVRVARGSEAIPGIVDALVRAGCRVHEVSRERDDLRQALRRSGGTEGETR